MMDTVSTQSSLLQFVDNNIPHAHLRSPPMLPGAAGPAAVSAGVKPTKICGHEVYFPVGKTPFSAQKSVISKALIALNKKYVLSVFYSPPFIAITITISLIPCTM